MTGDVVVSEGARVDRPWTWVWRILAHHRFARVGSWLLVPAVWVAISVAEPRIAGPVPVAEAFVTELTSGELVGHFGISLRRFLVGMVIGLGLGLVVGIALGIWRVFDLLLSGPAIAALAIPSIIWALLATMWFGFGDTAPIFTVAISALPFIGVNVTAGIQAMPGELTRMSTAFGVPFQRRLIHLLIPAVTGYLFAGGRLAMIVGWQALLLSEWFGAVDGVGFRARYWYDANRPEGTLAWIVLFIIFVVLLDRVVLERMSRWVFRWRAQESSRPAPVQEA